MGARWPSGLERWTGDRVVLDSNPAGGTSLLNFGNCVYPALPVSFGRDTKSCCSLLSSDVSGVAMAPPNFWQMFFFCNELMLLRSLNLKRKKMSRNWGNLIVVDLELPEKKFCYWVILWKAASLKDTYFKIFVCILLTKNCTPYAGICTEHMACNSSDHSLSYLFNHLNASIKCNGEKIITVTHS